MGFFKSFDEKFEEKVDKLSALNHIPKLDELIKILRVISKTNYLNDLSDIEIDEVLPLFDTKWVFREEDEHFIGTAEEGFDKSFFKIIFASYDDFIEFYKIVKTSYIFNNKDTWKNDENLDEKIINLCKNLTYYVEDYENDNYLFEDSIDYFKRFQDVKWPEENVREFIINIESIIYTISQELKLDGKFIDSLNHCSEYLMVSNAVKNNRFTVMIEDVVVAYLTIFKLVIKDLESLIMDVESGKIVRKKKSSFTAKNICMGALFVIAIIFAISTQSMYAEILTYSDENISFDYFGEWSVESNNDYYLFLNLLTGDDYGGDIFFHIEEAPSQNLTAHYNLFEKYIESEGKEVYFVNKTTIDGVEGLDIVVRWENDSETEVFYDRHIIFIKNNKLYSIFSEDFKERYLENWNLIKKTFKVK